MTLKSVRLVEEIEDRFPPIADPMPLFSVLHTVESGVRVKLFYSYQQCYYKWFQIKGRVLARTDK